MFILIFVMSALLSAEAHAKGGAGSLCLDLFPAQQSLLDRADTILNKRLENPTARSLSLDEFQNFLKSATKKLNDRVLLLQKEKQNPDSLYRYSKRANDVSKVIDLISSDISKLIQDIEMALAQPIIESFDLWVIVKRISFALSYVASEDLELTAMQLVRDNKMGDSEDMGLLPRELKDVFIKNHQEQFEDWVNDILLFLDTSINKKFEESRSDFVLDDIFAHPFYTWQTTTTGTSAKLLARGMAPIAIPDRLVYYDDNFNRLPYMYVEHDESHRNRFKRNLYLFWLELNESSPQFNFYTRPDTLPPEMVAEFLASYPKILNYLKHFIEQGEASFQGKELQAFYDIAFILFHEQDFFQFLYQVPSRLPPNSLFVSSLKELRQNLDNNEIGTFVLVLDRIRSELPRFTPMNLFNSLNN